MENKRFFILSIGILFLFILAGCAQVQRPVTQEFRLQQQLESAVHWQNIAKANAERLIRTLAVNAFIDENGTGSPSVYIAEDDLSPFGMAMRGYLITELMAMAPGLQLSKDPDAPFVLAWDSQLVNRTPVRHKPFLGVPLFVGEMVATWIMGGGWNTSSATVPHTEFILTTNILLNDQCLARYSDTYYVNDDDWTNYVANTGSYLHPRSIAAKNEAWKNRLVRAGLLAH